jgi:DNA-binding NarL/FixJ family response regulator
VNKIDCKLETFALLCTRQAVFSLTGGHEMSCQDLHVLPRPPLRLVFKGALTRPSPRHVHDMGESTGSPDYRGLPLRVRPGRHASLPKLLSEREIQVLGLLRGSLSRREIAAELSLSPNTIKTQTPAIYRKLGVSTRTAAITRGQDTGML